MVCYAIRGATFWVILKNHDAASTKFCIYHQLTLRWASDIHWTYELHILYFISNALDRDKYVDKVWGWKEVANRLNRYLEHIEE